MANVAHLLLACLLSHIVDESWLVVPAKLWETVVPEFAVVVRVEVPMVARVAASSLVVQPHIEAALREEERQTIFAFIERKLTRVIHAVLK